MEEIIPRLYTLMQHLSHKSKAHISVHFVNGVYSEQECFLLPFEGIIHSCRFCDAAKTTQKGLDCCLTNKSLSIKKALQLGRLYVGTCYLGVTEIVMPVFDDGRPLCVIYIGNLLAEEQRRQTQKRLLRKCRQTGVDPALLLKRLSTVQSFRASELSDYMDTAQILSFNIKSMLGHIRQSRLAAPYDAQKSNRWLVRQVRQHVDVNYSTRLRLPSIAALYYVNPQYLCRLFSRETGVTFTDYLNHVRIEHARQLLDTTQDSVTEIALAVGFNQVPYFNTVFKKSTSLTPTQYRSREHTQRE